MASAGGEAIARPVAIADPEPGAKRVRVFSEKEPRLARESVAVGWSGVASPTHEDWIGLFPVGGAGPSRLDFVFTKGQPEGRLEFPIAGALGPKLSSGEYEFRLYGAGWKMLARSEPVRFSGGK